MSTKKSVNLMGIDISLEDIDKVKSPALKKILKLQYLRVGESLSHNKCVHGKYSVYTRYSKGSDCWGKGRILP